MSDLGLSTVHAVSIAGSTFAFGFILGWVWALFHFGGSSKRSSHSDQDDWVQ
jgi:hypothetical protein